MACPGGPRAGGPTSAPGSGAESAARVRRRLEELAARHQLDQLAVLQLGQLLQAVADDERAPTAVRDPARAVDIHVADSLSALDLAVVTRSREIVDIGPGAGFPGLPLAIALRASRVRLVESSSRACEFLGRAIAAARITGVDVVHQRAEAWAAGRDAHDLVLARAVAPLPVALEYAAPLLRTGGVALVWRGARNPAEEQAGDRAARILGLEPAVVRRADPFPQAHSHYLHLYLKVGMTPDRFPRRPGVAAKRPLAGGARVSRPT